MEEKKQVVHEYGIMDSVVWQCDDIRLGHAVSTFRKQVSFPASSKSDVVRMHFGLKGNYCFSYQQLNRSFDLIGGHHNIMYSPDFDIVIENKTLTLETFGIQFPKALFIQFTANASDALKRFAQDIMEGKSVMLAEHWGAIDPPIQQAIQQIIHCR